MTYKELLQQIKQKRSFLCVGLDSDIEKIPKYLLEKSFPQFEFNRQIIDATAPYTIAFKPNIAFYESHGLEGWKNLELTVKYIKEKFPEIFVIADAKRGDIGNSSKMYAKTFFEYMDFDAVTIAPYMGRDSIQPFLEYKNKWVIILALTSNKSASDFQYLNTGANKNLFQNVIEKTSKWGSHKNTMFVVGATKASMLTLVREIVPEHFLLIPGIGAQGGSLDDVVKYGINKNIGLLVNSSRGIIFSDSTKKFAYSAGIIAKELQKQMEKNFV